MRLADVGQDADARPGGVDECVEIAERARAHLDDRHPVVAVVEREQKLAHADLVVLVLRRRDRGDAAPPQELHEKCLGRRLAGRAADRHDAPARALAREPRQHQIGARRIFDDQRGRVARDRGRVGNDARGRAFGERARDEPVTVEALAAQREKRVAGTQRARVGRDREPAGQSFGVQRARRERRDRVRGVEGHRAAADARCANAARTSSRSSNASVCSPTI